MTNKSEGTSNLDILKWVLIIGLLVGGVAANSYFQHQDVAVRVIGWIILLGIVLAIAAQTVAGAKSLGFARESRAELRKVVWPTRQETIRMAAVVIVMVIVAALILWAIDSIFLWAVAWLTGQRG